MHWDGSEFSIALGRRLKWVAMTLLPAAVILIAAEFANRRLMLRTEDPYSMRFNKVGMRADEEVSEITTDKRDIVLLLGNSVTLGKEVQDRHLFTNCLAEEFPRYRIVNAGYDGANFLHLLNVYRKTLYKLKPKLVVLIPVPGDFFYAYDVDDTEELPFQYKKSIRMAAADYVGAPSGAKANSVSSSGQAVYPWGFTITDTTKRLHLRLREEATHLPTNLGFALTKADLGYTQSMGMPIRQNLRPHVVAVLRELNRMVTSTGGRLMMATVPSRHVYYIYDEKLSRRLYEDAKGVCDELGIEFHDLIPDVAQYYRPARKGMYWDKVHFTAAGHKVLADVFRDLLKTSLGQ